MIIADSLSGTYKARETLLNSLLTRHSSAFEISVSVDSFHELRLCGIPQERYARKNEAADLRRAFDLLDIKRDGHIDGEELAETFSRLGHKIKKVFNLTSMYSRKLMCPPCK